MGQSILITNRQRTKKINSRLLKQITAALLEELKVENAELGIMLVGAAEMARVNWNFLRHEGATDAITFDHNEPTKTRLAKTLAPPSLHGELFVCVDEAILQAKKFKTNWQSEVARYVIHGVLHLLGHDDLQPEMRRRMKRAENRLVRRLAGRFSFAQLARPTRLGA